MAERDEISTTNVRTVDAVGPGASPTDTSGTRGWRQWLRLDRIPEYELAVFWRQLALLIEVGVPLLKALYQVAERTSHRPLRRVIQHVAADIEVGNGLSEALAQHPQAFSTLTVQILQVAERGGVLDDSLRLVAEELERRVEIRGKVRRALAYPVTVLVVGLTVALFVLAYVVPEFTAIFEDQHVELPLLTRCVMGTAHFVARFWGLCVLVVIALGLLLASSIRTPQVAWLGTV